MIIISQSNSHYTGHPSTQPLCEPAAQPQTRLPGRSLALAEPAPAPAFQE